MKTITKSITILQPFQLAGMREPHAPGTFELQIDEDPIDVVWEAYHRTMTLILSSNGLTEMWPMSDEELQRTSGVISPLDACSSLTSEPTEHAQAKRADNA